MPIESVNSGLRTMTRGLGLGSGAWRPGGRVWGIGFRIQVFEGFTVRGWRFWIRISSSSLEMRVGGLATRLEIYDIPQLGLGFRVNSM